jgi:hypothetical protein
VFPVIVSVAIGLVLIGFQVPSRPLASVDAGFVAGAVGAGDDGALALSFPSPPQPDSRTAASPRAVALNVVRVVVLFDLRRKRGLFQHRTVAGYANPRPQAARSWRIADSLAR